MKYTNESQIPLSLAVYLATDHYDHNNDINTISVTGLLKPIREIILSTRIPESVGDISGLIDSRIGTSVHNGIEEAWLKNYKTAMEDLGYPDKIIKNIKINPEKVNEDDIPVYMEVRSDKSLGKWTISGKFDFVADGRLEDFKTTSTFTYIKKTNDEKYIQQGSIYRWLNPEIITQNHMAIQFIFKDFSAIKAMADKSYPSSKILEYKLNLMSLNETTQFIQNKLNLIEKYMDTPQEELPLCTDKELWMDAPTWKYYKNPAKTTRSTKNFDNQSEALVRLSQDGNVGIVTEVKSEAKACKYCNAAVACTQYESMLGGK